MPHVMGAWCIQFLVKGISANHVVLMIYVSSVRRTENILTMNLKHYMDVITAFASMDLMTLKQKRIMNRMLTHVIFVTHFLMGMILKKKRENTSKTFTKVKQRIIAA